MWTDDERVAVNDDDDEADDDLFAHSVDEAADYVNTDEDNDDKEMEDGDS